MKLSRPLLKKVAWWIVGGLVTYAVVGFLVLPLVLGSVLPKRLTEMLHRTVSIENIQINPFFLTVRVEKFSVQDRAGDATFLGFEELFVDAQIVSLVKGGPVLREVRLKAPQASIIRNEDQTYNFSDLLEAFAAKPAAPPVSPKEEKPFLFSINNIQLEGGRVEFEDKPKSAHHTVRDVLIAIPFLSNLPYEVETFVQPAFEAVINDTPFRLAGKTKPFHDTLETTLDINISDIALPKYVAYLPLDLPIHITKANLGIQAQVSFIRDAGKGASLVLTGQFELKDLAIADKAKHPILTLPLLTVDVESAEVLARKIHLSSVVLQSPDLHVRRDRAGTLNLMTMAPKTSAPQPPAETKEKEKKPKPAEPVLSLEVDEAKLTGAKVEFIDETTIPTVHTTIQSLDLVVRHFNTQKNSTSDMALSFILNKNGKIGVTGSVGADPPSAKLKVEIKDVGFVPFQPYISDKVNVLMTGGAITTKGDIEFARNTEQKPVLSFIGETAVTKFTLLDKGNSEDLLKWASLALNGVHVRTEPLKVDIKQVALTDFYSRLIVHPDGTLNVQGLVKQEPASTPPKGAAAAAPGAKTDESKKEPVPIAIAAVTLQGGRINFTDRFVKPNFTADMTKVGGKVAGLSSVETRRAEVELRGQLRDHSPLEISGTINPLSRNLFADIRMDFKDIELSPMSPYSARYAGYSIEKGKLSVSLTYHIEDRKLKAEHRVYIDQFTFGDKVESPDATSLPVRLAVSLLKDRNGVIDLNFPVSGSLDDPQFSVWGVILEIVKNLLIKAATSPFSLIQALVGDNVELSYVEFETGKSQLEGPAIEKLNTLAKVLVERPALSVDFAGHVDVDKDRERLRQEAFERKVKAQKLSSLVKKGEAGLTIESITIAPEEYEEYLTRAYKQESFPKPRNILGLNKSLPVPEMEKLMLTNLQITDEDLRQLATQRAQAVKDYLVTTGKVDSQRLFLLEAKTLAPERKEKLKDSRVDFALK